MPTRWRAQSTSTDQGAAQVMLNVTITSASVRTGRLPISQRSPSAMSWRTCVSTFSRTAPLGVPIRLTSTAPSATQVAWRTNGTAIPTENRNAPSAGPMSWLTVTKPAMSRALAMPRSGFSTSIGVRVPVVASAKTSAVPRANIVTSTNQMLTCPVTMTTQRKARTTVRIESTTMTIRRLSSRSASAPATSPSSSHGSCEATAAPATASGLCVCEATSSGPAATINPSPRLLAQDDASSQRNPMPRRAGTMVSTRRLTSASG